MTSRNRINPDGVHQPFSNYVHIVEVESPKKIIFSAGQVAADADGNVLPPDDFDAQCSMVMGNLEKGLKAAGASFADVTKVTIYICDAKYVPEGRKILNTYFGDNPPASTLVIARGLANPDFLLEVEATAVV